MGEHCVKVLGFKVQVIYNSNAITTATDTEQAVKALKELGVDLVLFVEAMAQRVIFVMLLRTQYPYWVFLLVKIHSGVYAITPKAAGRVVEMLVKGDLVTLGDADVMDIDEEAFRQGTVKAKRYGEMQVPSEVRYMQAVKNGGKETDELVLVDIAAYVVSEMDEDTFYIMGSGSTVAAVMEEIGLENTLLGVDLVKDQTLIAQDLTAAQLLEHTQGQKTKSAITLIGGQGHIFGRGNQQLSPALIRAIGTNNIIVIATKTKLQALNGRPLICDTGDSSLDDELTGYIKVTCGFNDHIMYAVGY